MLKKEDLIGFRIKDCNKYVDSSGTLRVYPNHTIDYMYDSPFEIVHLSYDVKKEVFDNLNIWVKTQPDNYVTKHIVFSCDITRRMFEDALKLCGIDTKNFLKT